MSKILILDTETTGKFQPALIDAAYAEVSSIEQPLTEAGLVALRRAVNKKRFNPGKPIEYGAMAIHHITDKDVVNCPPASEFRLPANVEYIIGHNVDYDWGVIGSPNVKRICTLALCRKLWPDTDSHSQIAMLYYLENCNVGSYISQAHSADTDVLICGIILSHIIKKTGVKDWDSLYLLSEEARIPTVMPFGKHKGEKLSDIPQDYKDWLLKQSDIDPYLVAALQPVLQVQQQGALL